VPRTLLPVLYLRGISTGDFQEALAALLGKDAPNLSPSVPGPSHRAKCRATHQDTLRRKVEQWEHHRHATITKVIRQFTTEQARIKLRSLYPSHHS